ncbi:MAG TPA: methyltransferase domain-containing protein [Methylocella sp.]|nr:methyltransferase domain-containing protein [Methylocella sp.]
MIHMIGRFRNLQRKGAPSTPLLDTLNVTTLREDPDLLENVIASQHKLAFSDKSVAELLESIYLLPDRAADFNRFAQSMEFATILRLMRIFGVTKDQALIEIGGGPGFLTWALHRDGYQIGLLEPNARWNTGTGYLRSRADTGGIEVFNDHLAWHAKPLRYDVFITKTCIHHFQNIGMVAASLRQKLSAGGRWFAFREQFADTPKELGEALANHPYCQRFGTYEWFYPAHHYAEAIELTGFRLDAVVPAGYANDCLGTYSEGPPSAESRRLTDKFDTLLAQAPAKSVDAFWREVRRNRDERAGVHIYTRPQAMIFTKI